MAATAAAGSRRSSSARSRSQQSAARPMSQESLRLKSRESARSKSRESARPKSRESSKSDKSYLSSMSDAIQDGVDVTAAQLEADETDDVLAEPETEVEHHRNVDDVPGEEADDTEALARPTSRASSHSGVPSEGGDEAEEMLGDEMQEQGESVTYVAVGWNCYFSWTKTSVLFLEMYYMAPTHIYVDKHVYKCVIL